MNNDRVMYNKIFEHLVKEVKLMRAADNINAQTLKNVLNLVSVYVSTHTEAIIGLLPDIIRLTTQSKLNMEEATINSEEFYYLEALSNLTFSSNFFIV